MAKGEVLSKVSTAELHRLNRETAEEIRKRQFQTDWNTSWESLRGTIIDREISIKAILNNPTDEESQRWVSMTAAEIDTDVNAHINSVEEKQINSLRLVAEEDSIARQSHIQSSPILARYR